MRRVYDGEPVTNVSYKYNAGYPGSPADSVRGFRAGLPAPADYGRDTNRVFKTREQVAIATKINDGLRKTGCIGSFEHSITKKHLEAISLDNLDKFQGDYSETERVETYPVKVQVGNQSFTATGDATRHVIHVNIGASSDERRQARRRYMEAYNRNPRNKGHEITLAQVVCK